MDKEIVVKGEFLKRLVGWLEKKSLVMRALVLSVGIFSTIVGGFLFLVAIYTFLGKTAFLLTVLFLVLFIFILMGLIYGYFARS